MGSLTNLTQTFVNKFVLDSSLKGPYDDYESPLELLRCQHGACFAVTLGKTFMPCRDGKIIRNSASKMTLAKARIWAFTVTDKRTRSDPSIAARRIVKPEAEVMKDLEFLVQCKGEPENLAGYDTFPKMLQDQIRERVHLMIARYLLPHVEKEAQPTPEAQVQPQVQPTSPKKQQPKNPRSKGYKHQISKKPRLPFYRRSRKVLPDVTALHQLIDYNFVTGVMKWKKRKGCKTFNTNKAGQIAGHTSPHGAYITINNKTHYQWEIVCSFKYNGQIPPYIQILDGNVRNMAAANLQPIDKYGKPIAWPPQAIPNNVIKLETGA
jgi:hypothetical protein